MATTTGAAPVAPRKLSGDFWRFFLGQTISNLGSSFTNFALPLLVFKLTHSAINLAITSAAVFLPYLLFGLLIGAWVDRVQRKRLMIVVDTLNTLLIASIPTLYLLGHLSIWYIYAAGFVGSTLAIFFQSAEFAAIPSLVGQDDLVTANGRIQASFSVMSFAGPLLAGALVAFIPLAALLYIDASSFAVSVITLALVRRSFNTAKDEPGERQNIGRDVIEGLRYVLRHPVLRNISLMMALVNFFGSTVGFELVYFSKTQLHSADWQYGVLNAAGPLGIVVLALLAGPLRKRFSFGRVALTALALEGLLTVALGFMTNFWFAVPIWAASSGLGILFNINTGSLRQAIVPNQLLGRVMSIAGVLAWSAIPVGTFLGGVAIQATGRVGLIFSICGAIMFLLPVLFAFSPLGHAERYLPKPDDATPAAAPEAVASEA